MSETLPHGTVVDREDGLPVRMTDRYGNLVLEAGWDEGALLQARLRIPDRREVVIRPHQAVHPVLGPCHQVTLGDERPLSLFEAVDLTRPDHVPAMDVPAALPAGAGTAILGFVARRAAESGRTTLRYRGPYPTGALFDALLECFTVDDPARDAARFVADAEMIALAARPVEVPVDLHPDPFERVWPSPDICVQLRRGPDRAWVGGAGFSALTAGARRIVADGDTFVAVLELGGSPWGVVARFAVDGSLLEGPAPVPPPPARLVGIPLPASIRQVMAEALPAGAPRLLRDDLARVLREVPIAWGDPGLDVAAVRDGGIVLHAGLLERLASHPPQRILEAIGAALEEPARRLALGALTGRGQPRGG